MVIDMIIIYVIIHMLSMLPHMLSYMLPYMLLFPCINMGWYVSGYIAQVTEAMYNLQYVLRHFYVHNKQQTNNCKVTVFNKH